MGIAAGYRSGQKHSPRRNRIKSTHLTQPRTISRTGARTRRLVKMMCGKCGKQAFLIDIERHVSSMGVSGMVSFGKIYGCPHCGWRSDKRDSPTTSSEEIP